MTVRQAGRAQLLRCDTDTRELTGLKNSKRVRSVAYVLRCLSEGAQEAAAHPLAIAKSGCTGDLFGRQSALLEHQSGGFEPEIFDRLGG